MTPDALAGTPFEEEYARTAPTLLIIGDSDIVRPEHAVLPGTTHITVVDQVDLLLTMIPAFLDAPMPKD
jgi:hypothetical protein